MGSTYILKVWWADGRITEYCSASRGALLDRANGLSRGYLFERHEIIEIRQPASPNAWLRRCRCAACASGMPHDCSEAM